MNWWRKIRISMLHATYHRNMKRAVKARKDHDLEQFKQAIYNAEDAWRKIVVITEKLK